MTTTTTLDRGAFVVSIDTELAWGEAHKRDGSVAGHHFEREREVVEGILDVFARYDISATWAVVGHLFLDRCEGHPDLPGPAYDWLDGDWLDIDPCADVDAAPWYYGRDIVERLTACPVHQEVGSHSFSHVIVDDPGCSADVFAAELTAARQVAEPLGVELRSFVYPRNAIAHLDTLRAAGFTSYRGGRPAKPFAGLSGWQRKAALLVDRVSPRPGSAVRPEHHDSGVWNIPQTYLFAPVTAGHHLPPALWARRPIGRPRAHLPGRRPPARPRPSRRRDDDRAVGPPHRRRGRPRRLGNPAHCVRNAAMCGFSDAISGGCGLTTRPAARRGRSG